jgi:hypothetical protein
VKLKPYTSFYGAPNTGAINSRRLRWAGHVAHMGWVRNAYNIFVGILEGKRPLGRPRRSRWEDNIRMDLRETDGEGVEWIHLY